MDEERMYTVAQVAERLQASPATLRAWLRTGQLHGVRMGGTKLGWRIPSGEVERLLRGAGEAVWLRAAIESALRDLDMADHLEPQGGTDPAAWRDSALRTLRAALAD